MKALQDNSLEKYTFMALLIILILALPLSAVSKLKQYQKAPTFELPLLKTPAQSFKLQDSKIPTVLVFGELYHKNTKEALKELHTLRRNLNVQEQDLTVRLIITQKLSGEEMKKIQFEKDFTDPVLLDEKRKTFAAYGVLVLPSIVVLDAEGKIVMALSGYPLSFTDLISDAILFSTGDLTRSQFEASARNQDQPRPVEENKLRAQRLAGLARQLFRRGYAALALERYQQVLKLNEKYLPARIGMARCLIQLDRIPDAEAQLRDLLDGDPKNIDANLILAQVEINRGGKELKTAQSRLDQILLLSSQNPRALYLLGLVFENQEKPDKALLQYKKAAQILLERAER